MARTMKRNYRRKPALKRQIQRVINENRETKLKGYTYNLNPVGSQTLLPFDVNLTDISEGTAQLNRVGNQIRITGFFSKFTYAAADDTNRMRVVLYIPRDPSDILQTPTIDSLIDLDKFTILFDETINLVNGTSKDLVQKVMKKKFNKNDSKGILSIYNGPRGTDNAKNTLRIHWISDSEALSHPTISGKMRIYYKDV